MTAAQVHAVSMATGHRFSRRPQTMIRLKRDWGVEGDAQAGVTVQHRARARQAPVSPTCSRFTCIHAELIDELHAQNLDVNPGSLGEKS